jgi:hypothetical protein
VGKNYMSNTSGPLTVKFVLRGVLFSPEKMPFGPERVHLGGFQFELALFDEVSKTKAALEKNNWNMLTASITVRGLSKEQLPEIERVVCRVCWLLSFAEGALVAVNETEIQDDPSTPSRKCIQRIIDSPRPWVAPIDLESAPGAVRQWLENTYTPFVEAEGKYHLNGIIHLLSLAGAEDNITIQALLVANTLEILRYNFAKNVLVPSNRALQKGDQFCSPIDRKSLGFRAILNMLVSEINITNAWKGQQITDFRNKIIHEGEILEAPDVGEQKDKQDKSIMEALHFCHVVVLALLEWDKAGGDYVPMTNYRLGRRKFIR